MRKEDIESKYDEFFGTGLWESDYKNHIVEFTQQCLYSQLSSEDQECKKPYCCPVCNGNGQVPNGFYNQVSGVWATSSITPESCRSCNGTGVLWSKDSEIVLK